jgi:hypothetical protein
MAKIEGIDGNVANVDTEGRLLSFSISQTEDRHAAGEQRYWSVSFSVTPTGANDLFFYIKNEGLEDLFITDFRMASTVVTKIIIRAVTGTASAGTDSALQNRSIGGNDAINGIIQHDVDFTGLVNGNVIFFDYLDVANKMFHLKTSSTVIIPKGRAVAIERVAATGVMDCVISVKRAE